MVFMNEQTIIKNNILLSERQTLIRALLDEDFQKQAAYLKAVSENREMLYIMYNYRGKNAEIITQMARKLWEDCMQATVSD